MKTLFGLLLITPFTLALGIQTAAADTPSCFCPGMYLKLPDNVETRFHHNGRHGHDCADIYERDAVECKDEDNGCRYFEITNIGKPNERVREVSESCTNDLKNLTPVVRVDTLDIINELLDGY